MNIKEQNQGGFQLNRTFNFKRTREHEKEHTIIIACILSLREKIERFSHKRKGKKISSQKASVVAALCFFRH